MIRRLFRLAVLAGAAAAVTAWLRARQRSDDPLPTPAGSPSGPWPPLRNESPSQPAPSAPAATEPASPAARQAPARTTEPTVVPEPDGVPVADGPSSSDAGQPWREPTADGGCPPGFPIKAKMSSKIFHAPGQLNYDRTTPDRCYADAAAAEADGLRAAKR